jgi:hypothetical protein
MEAIDHNLSNSGNCNDSNIPGEDAEQKLARKRRSKNDPEGRAFKCDICGKSYLSSPAMTQHIKTKHSEKIGDYKRQRGRPKKSEGDTNEALRKEIFIKNFFSKANRARKESEEYIPNLVLCSSLRELHNKYESILFENDKCDKIEEHPLLKIKVENLKTDVKLITYDESIIMYLNSIEPRVNKDYFSFICKFLFLFRCCVNLNKAKENSNSSDCLFSTTNTPESVPNLCNEFMIDFMENNNFFNLDSQEVIEIIQHFCNWLYESGLTMSMLTLLSQG